MAPAERLDVAGHLWRRQQTVDEDDDMLLAMARELVETTGIGETAKLQ
jgi:hypothetical protein